MNLQALSQLKAPALTRLLEDIRTNTAVAVGGVPEGLSAFLATVLALQSGKRVMLVCPNDLKANRLGDDLVHLLGEEAGVLLGGELDLTRGASSHESAWRRLETFSRRDHLRVLCTSMDAVMQRLSRPEPFFAAVRTITVGERYEPEQLVEDLVRCGYERIGMVEGKGQCAIRGSILDVYPPESSAAIRIEFFDDEVDSIRTFDCISQRTVEQIQECCIGPATEVILPPEQAEQAAERMRTALDRVQIKQESPYFSDLPAMPEAEDDAELFDQQLIPNLRKKADAARKKEETKRRLGWLREDAELVAANRPFRRIRSWVPVLTEHTCFVMDWYPADVVLLMQPDHLRERCAERTNGYHEELKNAMERGEAVAEQGNLLASWDEILPAFGHSTVIALTEILQGLGGVQTADAIDLGARALDGYRSRLKDLATDLQRWNENDIAAVILSGGVSRGKRLAENLQELGCRTIFSEEALLPEKGTSAICPISLSAGFVWPDASLAVISETEVFGSSYRRANTRRNSGEKLSSFTDLSVGDFVVHEDHGIARFGGTTRIQTNGVERDYIVLNYAGTDKLYVPVEQLERVQKYIGNPNDAPKLNDLGGNEWQRQKSKARAGLRKIAFDLVKLYAERSQNTGYAFSKDTPFLDEFEERFPYELTPDQKASVAEIYADMESDHNMDRLLCGDVGYGKTEVSLRAAFKAIGDGKQVAILAPTTILARQHENTIKKRFAGFPVTAAGLSRFHTSKQTKQTLADLAEGKIDIIAGTHRLLAKDVKFKNLGLLIVDEEQRFGVAHKEQIKNFKKQVDVLTMSATPIPRTLHMSMVGIRDMSVLETPPADRLPVQTHVVEYNDAVIRDAILRELSRGGQVYFLYNQVQTIDKFHDRLQRLIPEARICVAHGQMKEHALEDAMMDFYAGSYDVLLCTTIVENGVDVPTANTMIVFDADRFGLSQLYQLRGRVGRSNRQAYAYFTVRPERSVSETAQKRLAAIREFTEFGAGFRIAMRDLEIRGAGNILGAEQHGQLTNIGYDMYCKLMEEALREARGTVSFEEKPLETRVDLKVNAFLPSDYVSDERQRMEMYKRIGSVVTQEDRLDVESELLDRYGDIPVPVSTLLDVAQLRGLANRLGAAQVLRREQLLLMRIDARYAPDPGVLLAAMKATDPRLGVTRLKGADALSLKVGIVADYQALRDGVKVLSTLCEALKPVEITEEAETDQ